MKNLTNQKAWVLLKEREHFIDLFSFFFDLTVFFIYNISMHIEKVGSFFKVKDSEETIFEFLYIDSFFKIHNYQMHNDSKMREVIYTLSKSKFFNLENKDYIKFGYIIFNKEVIKLQERNFIDLKNKKLDLSYCKLSKVPKFKNGSRINLNGNYIKDISNMSGARKFDLKDNGLEIIHKNTNMNIDYDLTSNPIKTCYPDYKKNLFYNKKTGKEQRIKVSKDSYEIIMSDEFNYHLFSLDKDFN